MNNLESRRTLIFLITLSGPILTEIKYPVQSAMTRIAIATLNCKICCNLFTVDKNEIRK